MASHQPKLSGLRLALCLLSLSLPAVIANDPVSITVSHIHRCVTACVSRGLNTDIGDILRCGVPYLNDCYCATATSALREVESFAAGCASERCQAGDFTHDLSGIKSAYASYCAGAGYDQGLEAWFAPAEPTDEPDPTGTGGDDVETSTQLTLVTQTTTGNSAGSRSRVIVHQTSTVWVDPSGSPVPAPSSGGGGVNVVALGAGLGAGLGVVLIIIGIVVWFCLRRRRRARAAQDVIPPPGWPAPAAAAPPMTVVPPAPVLGPSPAPVAEAGPGLLRKPVATAEVIPSLSPVSELNGHGQRPELGSKSVTHAPISPMESPVPAQTRPYEMWNNSPRPELYGQGGSPPPNYHQLDNTQRTELP